MAVLEHTHSYVRWEKRFGELQYKCDDPHCTHFASKSFIRGKASLCPNCGKNELILDREALRRSRPLCIECRDTKESKAYRAGKAVLEDLLNLEGEIKNNDSL